MVMCINPNVQCSQTKINCVAISIPGLVAAGSQERGVTADALRKGTEKYQCSAYGCAKAHQAIFLSKRPVLPKVGVICLVAKGPEKNASGRWAILVKRGDFSPEQLNSIDNGN